MRAHVADAHLRLRLSRNTEAARAVKATKAIVLGAEFWVR
jgi:hypothetical protein